MPYRVVIKGGLIDVVLPDSNRHQGGEVVVLTDEEYDNLSETAVANVLVDAGTYLAGGQVTSVNTATGAVVLNAADVGAISLSDKGVASGVATLDSGGKVPASQLQSQAVTSVNNEFGAVMLTAADVGALAVSARGAASGVAALDGSSLVPVAQIPALPASKIGSGTISGSVLPKASAVADLNVGTTLLTDVTAQINALLASLRAAGYLAS